MVTVSGVDFGVAPIIMFGGVSSSCLITNNTDAHCIVPGSRHHTTEPRQCSSRCPPLTVVSMIVGFVSKMSILSTSALAVV